VLLLLSVRIQPLNYSDSVVVKVFFGFVVNLALLSLFCSKVINRLFKRPNVLLVCILIIANLSFAVVIRKQRYMLTLLYKAFLGDV
jgi:hypothetical protein